MEPNCWGSFFPVVDVTRGLIKDMEIFNMTAVFRYASKVKIIL